MKARSIALATAYSAQTRTTAFCWKATRRDGIVLAVTSLSQDIFFEGVLYLAREGFNPKSIDQDTSAAVANTQVEGALSDEITELDFEAGLWDGCTVEMFEVNYRSLSDGAMRLATFTMGDIKVTRSAFNAEMRGLTQRLQKTVGRLVTKGCPWVFGSISPDNWTPACNKALGPLTVTGTLTGATDRRTFADSARAEAADYFGAGVIEFTSGANIGQALEIYSFASGAFVTYLPFLNNPAIGDTYSLTPGCRKRYTEDCRTKFANTNNFGGFDQLPGPDKVLGLGGTEGSNL
jgi:uncharacterized phage protein (TIGR02218 family)